MLGFSKPHTGRDPSSGGTREESFAGVRRQGEARACAVEHPGIRLVFFQKEEATMRGRLFIPALLALCCATVIQTLAAAVAAPAVERPTGLL